MAEESTHHPAPDLGDIYPESGAKATPALVPIITSEIEKNGPIPFSEFMATALYHPEFGYYSSERQKTGKQGDFITSVSVGQCFGIILARRLHRYWQEIDSPASFHIIEPGAHDGTLADDILSAIRQLSEAFYEATHYHLVETSPRLRKSQSQKLAQTHDGKFTPHDNMASLHLAQGAIISNELIDAFPVELVKLVQGSWAQQMVTRDEQGDFTFTDQEIQQPELKAFFASLGNDFPEGYTTEYNPGISQFAREAGKSLDSGLLITIDYGHLQHDLYHPDRSTGTLQTFHAHTKAENPLLYPGEIDITTHIDFSRLQSSCEQAGFHSPWFGTQASYLTRHAREWLLEMEGKPDPSKLELIRQFQTLTHPSMLGTRFSVLEMRK